MPQALPVLFKKKKKRFKVAFEYAVHVATCSSTSLVLVCVMDPSSGRGGGLDRPKGTTCSADDFGSRPIFQSICQLKLRL